VANGLCLAARRAAALGLLRSGTTREGICPRPIIPKLLITARAVLIFALMPVAFADDLTGQASIIDGDTLEIHGTRIRLWGMNAPESSQLCRGEDSLPYRCGAKAANDLDAFIAGRPVSCIPISLDQYGRTVATCSVGGVHLGEWLVRNGLALDWPQYSKGNFDTIQREAEHAGRGMWAGSYVEPWLYRVSPHPNDDLTVKNRLQIFVDRHLGPDVNSRCRAMSPGSVPIR